MYNIKFKGKSYSIDKSLLEGAVASLEATLSELSGDTPEEDESTFTLDESSLDEAVLA